MSAKEMDIDKIEHHIWEIVQAIEPTENDDFNTECMIETRKFIENLIQEVKGNHSEGESNMYLTEIVHGNQRLFITTENLPSDNVTALLESVGDSIDVDDIENLIKVVEIFDPTIKVFGEDITEKVVI